MKFVAVVGFGLALTACGVAAAQIRPKSTLVEQAIGNTLEVAYPDGGPTITFNFKSDGTFTAVFPDGPGHGDYLADRRYLCFMVRDAAESHPGRNVRCEKNTTEGKTIGQSWTVTDSHGDKPTLTIRRGARR